MKKLAGVIFVILFSGLSVSGQEYQTSLGVRGGYPFSGISLKHFLNRSDAIEGVAAFHHRGLMLAGMFQRHANAFDAPGLYWYYGGGAQAGFYDKRYTPWFASNTTGSFAAFGVLGVVGLEYKIEEIPITIGVDLIPVFSIFGHTGFWMNGGVSLRYTF